MCSKPEAEIENYLLDTLLVWWNVSGRLFQCIQFLVCWINFFSSILTPRVYGWSACRTQSECESHASLTDAIRVEGNTIWRSDLYGSDPQFILTGRSHYTASFMLYYELVVVCYVNTSLRVWLTGMWTRPSSETETFNIASEMRLRRSPKLYETEVFDFLFETSQKIFRDKIETI